MPQSLPIPDPDDVERAISGYSLLSDGSADAAGPAADSDVEVLRASGSSARSSEPCRRAASQSPVDHSRSMRRSLTVGPHSSESSMRHSLTVGPPPSQRSRSFSLRKNSSFGSFGVRSDDEAPPLRSIGKGWKATLRRASSGAYALVRQPTNALVQSFLDEGEKAQELVDDESEPDDSVTPQVARARSTGTCGGKSQKSLRFDMQSDPSESVATSADPRRTCSTVEFGRDSGGTSKRRRADTWLSPPNRGTRSRLHTSWDIACGMANRVTAAAARRLPDVCTDGVFRILDRDAQFGQSGGHWAIQNVTLRKARKDAAKKKNSDSSLQSISALRADINSLHAGDFFHTFLDAPLYKQIFAFAFVYVVCFTFFAFIYLGISKPCNLQLEGNFLKAYLLSLEAMITIGYGVPDPYMNGCIEAAITLTVQSLLHLVLSAIVIGVIFLHLSSPTSRAVSILYSDNAVIREIDGVLYFMFRVLDMRIQHALIEPHIRCYCLHKHPRRGFELTPMRLQHPDDELGGSLLMTMPTTIVHRIDAWSPLSPSGVHDKQYGRRRRNKELLHTLAWPGTRQRQVDSESGNRDSCICPVCGESFGTALMLEQHCLYNAKADRLAGFPENEGHHELCPEELPNLSHGDPSRECIQHHLAKQHIEVVVLVEGIEPTTSSTLQSRHSYLIGGVGEEHLDVGWDYEFDTCCMIPGDVSKGLALDLARFHTLHPSPPVWT